MRPEIDNSHILKKKHQANDIRPLWVSHVSYKWAMTRINPPQMRQFSYLTKKLTRLRGSRRSEWVMSHMSESCLIWASHVSYERVTSHMSESCLIWASHVSYERVTSHIRESRLIQISPEWNDFHIYKKKNSGLTESRRSEWVMSHMNDSRLV